MHYTTLLHDLMMAAPDPFIIEAASLENPERWFQAILIVMEQITAPGKLPTVFTRTTVWDPINSQPWTYVPTHTALKHRTIIISELIQ